MSFPFTLAQPARHVGPLPDAADVVVIGGGVIGVMTALFLARAGEKVVLCEKGRIAAEQSSRNWGWIRAQGRDPAEIPVVVEAQRIWADFAAQIGAPLGYRQSGVLYLAQDEAEMEDFAAFLPHARDHGLSTRLLSRVGLAALTGRSAEWVGGMFTPDDAQAEPWVAVPLLAEIAAEAGATLREGCAVRALDTAAGQVTGVVTEAGRIRATRVVVAAGAWSRLFLAAHGVAIPQLSVLASVAQTVPLPEVWPPASADRDFAFRPRADGGYTLAPGAEHDFFIGPDGLRSFGRYLPVWRQDFRATHLRMAAPAGYPDGWRTPRNWGEGPSPFEDMRILNPAPNPHSLTRVQAGFARAFPQIGRPQIQSVWAGMIDTMPDVVPVVDHAPLAGLTIATGMSGHGFGIGPGMGRVVADLVRGRAPGHDLSRFRFGRFGDGSPTRPGSHL